MPVTWAVPDPLTTIPASLASATVFPLITTPMTRAPVVALWTRTPLWGFWKLLP